MFMSAIKVECVLKNLDIRRRFQARNPTRYVNPAQISRILLFSPTRLSNGLAKNPNTTVKALLSSH